MDAATQHVPSRACVCFLSFCVLLQLLTVTTSATHRGGRGAALTYGGAQPTCDCCHVRPDSLCCLDCLAELTSAGRSELSPLSSGLLPAAAAVGGGLGESFVGGGGGGAESREEGGRGVMSAGAGGGDSLPGCRCCLSEVYSSRQMSLVLNACCSVCDRARSRLAGPLTPPLTPAFRGPLLQPRRDDVVSGDVDTGLVSTGRVQKRMTSMDCMCCMNSGINDCCSKCRIF